MGEMLQADLDTLQRLGGILAGHADAVEQLRVSAGVRMPDSPVQEAADRIGTAVTDAYRFLGESIRRMSDTTHATAQSYDEVDHAFAAQLHQYSSGE